jgi:hypothetical protein
MAFIIMTQRDECHAECYYDECHYAESRYGIYHNDSQHEGLCCDTQHKYQ